MCVCVRVRVRVHVCVCLWLTVWCCMCAAQKEWGDRYRPPLLDMRESHSYCPAGFPNFSLRRGDRRGDWTAARQMEALTRKPGQPEIRNTLGKAKALSLLSPTRRNLHHVASLARLLWDPQIDTILMQWLCRTVNNTWYPRTHFCVYFHVYMRPYFLYFLRWDSGPVMPRHSCFQTTDNLAAWVPNEIIASGKQLTQTLLLSLSTNKA